MEKKQFIYTTPGKVLMGLLCLVSFGVLVISIILTICGYEYYGESIITDSKDSYYETDAYQDNLKTSMDNIMDQLLYTPSEIIKKNQFSVIDVAQKELYVYDLDDMYDYFADGLEYADTLTYYDTFRKEYENISGLDMSDYKKARSVLEDESYKDSYIYFDDVSFKALFEDTGIKNINHRFSRDFSEDAYFVFDYRGKTKEAEKTLEKIKKCDREDSVGENYNLTDITYAVYDDGLYYSTDDDYFDTYNSYMYRVQDVKSILEETDPDGTRYDSIVFALLMSANLGDSWIEEPYYAYANVKNAKEELYNNYGLNKTGDFYLCYEDGDLECSEDKLKSNISSEESITVMEQKAISYLEEHHCVYYSFMISGDGAVQYISNGQPFEYKEAVENRIIEYAPEKGILLVYGYDTKNYTTSGDGVASYASRYEFFAKYARFIIAAGALALILTVLFAILLICVTGRKARKSPEVSLGFYDRLYGEFWWGITLFTLLFVGSAEISIFNVTLRELNIGTLVLFTSFCVVFAFFVMIFTLSFCRRIKGKLFIKRSLLIRVVKWLWKRGKSGIISLKNHTFTRVKGTSRLVLLYGIFSVINIIIILVGYTSYTIDGLMLVCFLILQVVGLFAVLFLVRDTNRLIKGVEELAKGNLDYKIKTDEKIGIYKELANNMNHIGDGLKIAVETSIKDERMKTELITNVSHDLKTPLTSIINYIELLKKEPMESEDAKHYIDVLDNKAQRLKHLTEDLVEAAKANSGNIELHMMKIDFNELVSQSIGEFEERFTERELEIVTSQPDEPVRIMADGRRLYRVLENVLQNVCKYAMAKTRVYIELTTHQEKAVFTIKNVSKAPLNISPEELMERFTRGDESRTTEGSGLGLSIAKDLTALQKGTFDIILDGDLFKVVIEFHLEQ